MVTKKRLALKNRQFTDEMGEKWRMKCAVIEGRLFGQHGAALVAVDESLICNSDSSKYPDQPSVRCLCGSDSLAVMRIGATNVVHLRCCLCGGRFELPEVVWS